MKVNIGFAQFITTIEFKPFLGNDIEKYIEAFNNWYYEEAENGTILRQRSDLPYEIFDANVIIDWLLEASPTCEAKIVEPFLNEGEEDSDLPYMCF